MNNKNFSIDNKFYSDSEIQKDENTIIFDEENTDNEKMTVPDLEFLTTELDKIMDFLDSKELKGITDAYTIYDLTSKKFSKFDLLYKRTLINLCDLELRKPVFGELLECIKRLRNIEKGKSTLEKETKLVVKKYNDKFIPKNLKL
jgi:hypothetical protein